jgi:hypothetical protein
MLVHFALLAWLFRRPAVPVKRFHTQTPRIGLRQDRFAARLPYRSLYALKSWALPSLLLYVRCPPVIPVGDGWSFRSRQPRRVGFPARAFFPGGLKVLCLRKASSPHWIASHAALSPP